MTSTRSKWSLQLTDEDFREVYPDLFELLGQPYVACPSDIGAFWPVLDDSNTIIGFNDLQNDAGTNDDDFVYLDADLEPITDLSDADIMALRLG